MKYSLWKSPNLLVSRGWHEFEAGIDGRTASDWKYRLNGQSPGPAVSDGSTASYYELPAGARELQHLISHRDMNAQVGEIFRACYRYGRVAHSPCKRDIKKIIFYAQAELDRLEALDAATSPA
jgi:hypothetical protein